MFVCVCVWGGVVIWPTRECPLTQCHHVHWNHIPRRMEKNERRGHVNRHENGGGRGYAGPVGFTPGFARICWKNNYKRPTYGFYLCTLSAGSITRRDCTTMRGQRRGPTTGGGGKEAAPGEPENERSVRATPHPTSPSRTNVSSHRWYSRLPASSQDQAV